RPARSEGKMPGALLRLSDEIRKPPMEAVALFVGQVRQQLRADERLGEAGWIAPSVEDARVPCGLEPRAHGVSAQGGFQHRLRRLGEPRHVECDKPRLPRDARAALP